MLDKFVNWLKSFNASTHFVAVSALALVAAFKGYSPFHDLVVAGYHGLPGWAQTLIGTALFIAVLYKSGALKVNGSPMPQGISGFAGKQEPGGYVDGQKLKALGLVSAGLGFLAHWRHIFLLVGALGLLGSGCLLLTGCMVPTWLTDATTMMPVLVSAAGSVLSFVLGLTGNVVAAGVVTAITDWANKISAGLANVESLVEQYNTTPGESLLAEIESAAQLVVSDISTFDSILGVPAAVSTPIQKMAQLILTQLEAWSSLLPALKAAPAAPGTNMTIIVPFSKTGFKAAFNDVLDEATGNNDVDAALAGAKRL